MNKLIKKTKKTRQFSIILFITQPDMLLITACSKGKMWKLFVKELGVQNDLSQNFLNSTAAHQFVFSPLPADNKDITSETFISSELCSTFAILNLTSSLICWDLWNLLNSIIFTFLAFILWNYSHENRFCKPHHAAHTDQVCRIGGKLRFEF